MVGQSVGGTALLNGAPPGPKCWTRAGGAAQAVPILFACGSKDTTAPSRSAAGTVPQRCGDGVDAVAAGLTMQMPRAVPACSAAPSSRPAARLRETRLHTSRPARESKGQ